MSFRQRTVVGNIFDPQGIPIISGTVTFQTTLAAGYTPTHLIIDRPVTVVTDSTGHFTIPLWCDEDSSVPLDYTVKFPIVNSGPSDASHSATFSLRYGTTSINISELISPVDDGAWGWYSADEIDAVDGASVSVWHDRTPNQHDMITNNTPTVAVLKTNQINGLPIVRFNGTSDFLRRYVSIPVLIYDAFFVMQHRGATFSGTHLKALGDIDSDVLVGTASGTNWAAMAGVEYRRNGVVLSSPPAAPMNAFDVIHLRFTTPQSFNGAVNIASSASDGISSSVPLDIAEVGLYADTALDTAAYMAIEADLMSKYAIG